MTVAMLFLIAALILFVVDVFGVAVRVNLQSAGLACLVLSMILGSGIIR